MELKRGGASRLRALATECLPFELPLEAGGPWLYRWVDSRALGVSEHAVRVRPRSRADLLLLALFQLPEALPVYADDKTKKIVTIRASEVSRTWRAPAMFMVRRDQLRTRQLEMLALGSQFAVAFVYATHKDSILYQSARSRISLRAPSRATSPGRYLQSRYKEARANRTIPIETTGRHLETFNSYFAYRRYAFVGEFYDSKRWNALEAHWRFMRRVDVSNCFKSIYTHSIAWATGSDAHSKAHLGNDPAFEKLDFGRAFDKVMQTSNWGETHGICVGPEASRVFAEIIFQKLDLEITQRLSRRHLTPADYEVLRYVDDYFIFSRHEATLAVVSEVISEVLGEGGFVLNANKTRDYVTPFTTDISVRKASLKVFLKQALPLKDEIPNFDIREISVHLKSALVGADNDAQAVGSALTQVELRLRKFLRKRLPKCRNLEEAREVSSYSWGFVHSMVYQYLSHPSVTSAMKVVRTLRDFRTLCVRQISLPVRDVRVIEHQTDELLHFAVSRAVERLAEVRGSEVEICHFLSLASAAKLTFASESRLVDVLINRLAQGLEAVSSPKSNQAGVFLLLSTMKYFLPEGRSSAKARKQIIELCNRYTSLYFSQNYLPGGRVQRHASQELLSLALLECPYLSNVEKTELLGKPWVLEVLANAFGSPSDTNHARRFLKRCVSEERGTEQELGAFVWTDDDFDELIYQKEPQFVY